MTNFWKDLKDNWQDSVNVLIGLWLLASPWLLAFTDATAALGNAIALGLIIGLMALAALVDFHEWEEWVSVVLGLWLVVSPWALGFATVTAATWNFVIAGVLVVVLAGYSLWHHGETHSA